jgi:hypothetical protein
MPVALTAVTQGNATSVTFVPNAKRATDITQCTAVTAFPDSYQSALYAYQQLITMWGYQGQFPAYDGTLFPEEAAFLHFLFNDILYPAPVSQTMSTMSGVSPTAIITPGTGSGATLATTQVMGSGYNEAPDPDVWYSSTGINCTAAALSTALTIQNFKITIADLPLRSIKRPWHPYVLRELAIRTAMKNI